MGIVSLSTLRMLKITKFFNTFYKNDFSVDASHFAGREEMQPLTTASYPPPPPRYCIGFP